MSAGRLELTVSAGDAGLRLDRFLARPVGSRAQAQQLIEAGRVQVNGSPRPKRVVLQAGDVVEVVAADPHPDGAPASRAPFSVAHEDEHLLVVDKPAGVVVHPARGHATGTLAQALGQAAGGEEPWRAGIVHRLDRDTSGLLVVAKDPEVHRVLKAMLASRRLRREYLALVQSHPASRTGTIDAPLGRDRRDRLKVSINTNHPRAAKTHFEVVQKIGDAALLRVMLETGRTHQIRAHLAAIGHPVCGDPLYGAPGSYGLQRQFLHAARLSFEHPVTRAEIDVRSELPADLARALRRAAG